jgi:hypothetical protein
VNFLFTRATRLIEIYTRLTVNVQIFQQLIEQIEAGGFFRSHVEAKATKEHKKMLYENFFPHHF